MADTTSAIELLVRARDDASGVLDHISESLGRMHEHMLRIRDIALGNIIGDIGMGGIDALTRGINEFGKGLISANADAEAMHQTLQALYGTKTEADQAFNWMTKFAMQAPFTRQSIIQAGVAIASFGGDITKVLPALGNVAAIMGQTMPTAAQAFNDALAGRFQMMNRDLHISKESLVQFGMEMDRSGHITNIQSFVTAFEKLAQTRFGAGMSLQMQTFNGQVSNLEDHFQLLQRTMGQGLFDAVKGQLFDLITFLNAHQNQISEFAALMGRGLADAAKGLFAFGQLAVSAIVPAVNVISKAWGVFSAVTGTVFGFVGKVIGAFSSWFTGTALPPIETAIGLIAQWWQENGTKIESALVAIWGKIKDFGSLVVSGLEDVWNYVRADTQFLWDEIQMVFTLGQDALSGNWGKFGADFVAGVRKLAGDSVQVFASMLTGMVDLVTRIAYSIVEAMIPVANNLMGPITWFAQQFRVVFKDIGGIVGAFVGGIVSAFTGLEGTFVRFINTLIGHYNDMAGLLHLAKKDLLIDPTAVPKRPPGYVGPIATPVDPGIAAAQGVKDWFDKHAPGLDKGQRYTPTQSVAQAQAAAEADRKRLITPFDTFVQQVAAKLQNMLDPSSPIGKTKEDPRALGAEIVRNLFGGFGGLAGGLTMDDLLKKLGISTIPGGQNFGPLPGAGGLPVAGFGTDAGATAAGGAGGGAGGGAAGQRAVTGRVALGNLGATFMSNVASLATIGQGTDPATRAAQAASAELAKQSTQGARTMTAAEEQVATMHAVHDVLKEVRDFLAKAAAPTATPPDPMRRLAVARPRVS